MHMSYFVQDLSETHYIVQAGLKFAVRFLSQPSEHWDYKVWAIISSFMQTFLEANISTHIEHFEEKKHCSESTCVLSLTLQFLIFKIKVLIMYIFLLLQMSENQKQEKTNFWAPQSFKPYRCTGTWRCFNTDNRRSRSAALHLFLWPPPPARL